MVCEFFSGVSAAAMPCTDAAYCVLKVKRVSMDALKMTILLVFYLTRHKREDCPFFFRLEAEVNANERSRGLFLFEKFSENGGQAIWQKKRNIKSRYKVSLYQSVKKST